MKYQINAPFVIREGRKKVVVCPFDGETIGLGPSWSHGLTHYRRADRSVGFCGVNWFEANAKEFPGDRRAKPMCPNVRDEGD
jgi:hypothetical protein